MKPFELKPAKLPKISEELYPSIYRAVRDGVAFWENGDLIGIASDGVRISLGNLYFKSELQFAENYLSENPTPDTW